MDKDLPPIFVSGLDRVSQNYNSSVMEDMWGVCMNTAYGNATSAPRVTAKSLTSQIESRLSWKNKSEKASSKSKATVPIETVTPITAEKMINRIKNLDLSVGHICLELDHWGYEKITTWLAKVQAITARYKIPMPGITIHGDDDQVTYDQAETLTLIGGLWLPRNLESDAGKDGATIMYELFSCDATKPQNEPLQPSSGERCFQQREKNELLPIVAAPIRQDPDVELYKDLTCGYDFNDTQDDENIGETSSVLDRQFQEILRLSTLADGD